MKNQQSESIPNGLDMLGMIEQLKEGFGFKAVGEITPENVKAVEPDSDRNFQSSQSSDQNSLLSF